MFDIDVMKCTRIYFLAKIGSISQCTPFLARYNESNNLIFIFLSQGSRRRLVHTHPKNTSYNFPSWLLCFRTLWCTFTRFNPLFWPFMLFRSIVVDLCSIHCHKSMQKLFRIAGKIGKILLRSGHTNEFLVDCEQSRYPYCTELFHIQICMQSIDYTLIWDGYDLSYLTHFHFRVNSKQYHEFY